MHSPTNINVVGGTERGRESVRAGGAANVKVVNVVNDNQSVSSRSPSPHGHYHYDDRNRTDIRNNSKAEAYAIANNATWPPWTDHHGSRYRDDFSVSELAELELLRNQARVEANMARRIANEKETEAKIESEINKYKLEAQARKHGEEDAVNKWQAKYDADERMKKAAEERAISKYKEDQAEHKRREEEAVRKYKLEEADRKKNDEQAVLTYKQKEAVRKNDDGQAVNKHKLKEKEKEKEVEDEMHKRLADFGFDGKEIEAITDPGKAAGTTSLMTKGFLQNLPSQYPNLYGGAPTYITVGRDRVDIASLNYFGLPWRYDYVSLIPSLNSYKI